MLLSSIAEGVADGGYFAQTDGFTFLFSAQNLIGHYRPALRIFHAPVFLFARLVGSVARKRPKIAANGPGIDGQYFIKIFQQFQTLKARDEVENTGVGLTIMKKIVEMYSGRVWVETKIGEWTTFWFTLTKTKT